MIKVAMGIILNEEGKVLIAKRHRNKHFGGLWEFPGGKFEDGETPAEALIRELKEEIDVEVEAHTVCQSYLYLDDSLEIEFYPVYCSIIAGKTKNLEHEEIAIVGINELKKFCFAPPDYEAIELLEKEYLKIKAKIGSIPSSDT